MATLVVLTGLFLVVLLAVLSVIAFVQSRQKQAAETRSGQRRQPSEAKKLQENQAKGQYGEEVVRKRLSRLDESVYTTYHSLCLPHPNGTQVTEIDHVVVSPYGVFAIETKNWAGTIYGEQEGAKWKQVLNPKTTHDKRNPLKQNRLHQKSLAAYLDIEEKSTPSVVCFHGDSLFGNPMPRNVVRDPDLHAYITSIRQQKLDTEAVARANQKLRELQQGPDHERYRRAHQEQIKQWENEDK